MAWPFPKKAAPAPAKQAAPEVPAGEAASAPSDGRERLSANDWAKRHGVNEVQAERAAMRAGRWHDLFTEEEFLALLGNAAV